MTNYQEKDLENFIESYLLENHTYIKRTNENFDKNLCIDTEFFENFLQATQSVALEELKKRCGQNYKKELFDRIFSQIKTKGIVKALQGYVEIKGIKFYLAFAKPNTNANAQSLHNYEQNTLSIIRQLYYSTQNKNSIDMVLFLNGLPLITIELKNHFTGQNVFHAIEQYKKDRNPKETLFNHTIVHFALDHDLCYMSTRLDQSATTFLPFNLGLNNGSGKIGLANGAGNPPSDGIKTAYLWEKIFKKDTLLNLLFNFVQVIKKENKEIIIFPRYHQFDVVEKLLTHAKEKGTGQRYLIQHSAGSGKSNSISWLAHHLVSLHKLEENSFKNIFDSIIVVTDRKVLDSQIRENVKAFSHTKNLVEAITHGSKQLKEALEEGKKIIITTIQKFPYILNEVKSLKSKTFAIIIDEAHSSQSGSNAQKMAEAIRDKSGDESQNLEDEILEIIKSKKLQPNASYFAFTATPKPKTLEMFGMPCEVDGEQKFIPFHLYSMKQAIEEGFILDVLKGYTTYKSYYKIISCTNDNPKYDKKRANAKLKAYVQNNIRTIEQKSQIICEHFFQNSFKKINGKAKAMIVTSSRENAVKYYLVFREYLRKNYPHFKAIVAFSGEINLEGEIYSESGLNGFSEGVLKDEFKKDEYRFLIVAEKYQTGFDEPLLHTMYVDKTLSGVSAVQTLSRLNRTCKNKEDTFVLDFANTHEDIAKAFSVFYEQTYLNEPTDDNRIFDLKANLGEYEIYTQEEIDDFTNAILGREKENVIHSKLDIMLARFDEKSDDEKLDFYSKAKTYLKEYSFLAQILPYEDVELEKLYILLKKLASKIILPKSQDLAKGILDNVDFDSYRLQLDKTQDIFLQGNGELKPSFADGSSKSVETELEELSNIIKDFNSKYANIDFNESDKIAKILYDIKDDIAKNERILESLNKSDMQNSRIEFSMLLEDKIQDILDLNLELFKQFNQNNEFKDKITNAMFNMICNDFAQIESSH
ncbi:TPA: type I restriction endonuclease subunit R [Campylobacter coli]|nr:type I restriction endonuclease subunit R [Campylobacter coli]HEB9318864.1 type I restriction endonuclease subunit R [Campylobacter coli]